MSLHGLLSVTIGVPNVEETAAYYTDFGLAPAAGSWFSTVDGGPQLRIVPAPTRRLVELHVAADDTDDLERAATNLALLGLGGQLSGASLATTEPVTGTRVYLDVAPRVHQDPPTVTVYNGPGRFDRTDYRATKAFFVDGLGFKISDRIKDMGAFMRCSTDHHNMLVLSAPVNFLHHTAWQVDDIDDVGRGAYAMLEGRPERHVWGLGRHFAGSNFFWYLKDPAGNFCEYYSDMDCIVDDQLWTPEDLEGARGLFAWGPPPPPSFLEPEDLAALMTGAHAAT